MDIYVVTKGYPYESGFVIGVFSSYDKAKELMMKDREEDKDAWHEIEKWFLDQTEGAEIIDHIYE